MSATLPEPRTIRRAKAVRERADEIFEDVAEFERRGQQQTDLVRELQALIFDCCALAREWRSLVERISNAAESGEPVDYRTLGEDAIPGADRTLRLYELTVELAKRHIQAGAKFQDWSDLVMAVREAQNVIEWVASWPTNASDQRQASREAIQTDELADLHSMAT